MVIEPRKGLSLCGRSDSDLGGCTETNKSTTGWVFQLCGCPVSWVSSLQGVVTTSTAEAETIALCSAARESIWIKSLVEEIGNISLEVGISCDNSAAVFIAKSPAKNRQRTKTLDIRSAFIRDLVERGEVTVDLIQGRENPADIFTKALGSTVFKEHLSHLGLGLFQ